jgi:hypothetical protein
VNSTHNDTHVCFVISKLSCGSSQKCSYMQQTLRKIMITTLQSPECGAKNLTRGPSQSRAPFSSYMVSPFGIEVLGIQTIYFHHVFDGSTATALDVKKVSAFRQGNDTDLHGYRLCVIGSQWQGCLMLPNRKLRVSTIDVNDRTCDQTPIFIDV